MLTPPPPPDPRCHLDNEMSLETFTKYVKGIILGLGGGGASKNKLKDTSFIFPMTNVAILGIFRTHAQKEYGTVLEMKSTPILKRFSIFTFLKLLMHLLKVWPIRT